MNLERKATKQLAIGGLISLAIFGATLIFTIPKAKNLFYDGEVYNTLLIKYGDINNNKKVEKNEEKAFQERIINSSRNKNINFVQIIDIPHTEYPQDIKTNQLISPEEFANLAEKAYSTN